MCVSICGAMCAVNLCCARMSRERQRPRMRPLWRMRSVSASRGSAVRPGFCAPVCESFPCKLNRPDAYQYGFRKKSGPGGADRASDSLASGVTRVSTRAQPHAPKAPNAPRARGRAVLYVAYTASKENRPAPVARLVSLCLLHPAHALCAATQSSAVIHHRAHARLVRVQDATGEHAPAAAPRSGRDDTSLLDAGAASRSESTRCWPQRGGLRRGRGAPRQRRRLRWRRARRRHGGGGSTPRWRGAATRGRACRCPPRARAPVRT
jgi:hypothetical protein